MHEQLKRILERISLSKVNVEWFVKGAEVWFLSDRTLHVETYPTALRGAAKTYSNIPCVQVIIILYNNILNECDRRLDLAKTPSVSRFLVPTVFLRCS